MFCTLCTVGFPNIPILLGLLPTIQQQKLIFVLRNMFEIDESSGPSLDVVKPERKICLVSDQETFIKCLSDDQTTSNIEVYTVANGVFYIDNALSESECSNLRLATDSNSSLSFWSPQGRGNEDVRRFRDADTIEMNSNEFVNTLWERLSSVVNDIHLELSISDDETSLEWERELVGDWMPTNFNNDLLFARYPCGGAFAPHTDGRAVHDFNTRSFYSVIVFLNTIPKGCGGGTRFYAADAVKNLTAHTNVDGKVHWSSDPSLITAEVDAVAGRLLIFHQSMVHEGVPPVSPYMKYIIRSDVMLSRTPAICDSPADREAYRIFRQAEDLAEEGRVDEAVPLFKKALKLSPEMARIMGQA